MLNSEYGKEFVLRDKKSMTFVYWFTILYIQYELGRILEKYCCNSVCTFCKVTIGVYRGWYNNFTGFATIWADSGTINKTVDETIAEVISGVVSRVTSEAASGAIGRAVGGAADRANDRAAYGAVCEVTDRANGGVVNKAAGRASKW